jgi:hypothetical protein
MLPTIILLLYAFIAAETYFIEPLPRNGRTDTITYRDSLEGFRKFAVQQGLGTMT